MRPLAVLPHRYQFVLVAVKGAHRAVGFCPDNQILKFIECGIACGQKCAKSAPVDETKDQAAVGSEHRNVPKDLKQKHLEVIRGHLP